MTPAACRRDHRRRGLALLLVAALGSALALIAVPAGAQVDTSTTTTQAAPTTTTTTTTRPGGTTTTSTTEPATVVTSPPTSVDTTTTLPPTTSTTLAPPVTEPAPTPVDAIDEDGADDVPTVRPVPPSATPHVRTPVDDAIAKLVGGQVKAAQAATQQATNASLAANKALADLEAQQADLQRTYENLYASQAAAAERLKTMRATMRVRAVALYLAGPAEPPIPVGTDVYDYGRRRVRIEALQQADKTNLVKYEDAKVQAGDAVNQLVSRLEDANAKVTAARADAELKSAVVQQSLLGLGTLQASSAVAVNGFVFPVGDPHNFTSTFGAPRMTGTAYYHLHQGNDIFAPYGTPLYAAERGVIDKKGTDRLGGTKLWVVGESGTTYYYAHLSAYADGIADGVVVEAGAVVGYVGNTGNAATTPPHLHFEIHPNNGPAVDPYPILKTVDDTIKRLALTTTTTAPPAAAP